MLLYKKLLLVTFGTTLVLSSRLRLGLPSGLFPSGFPTRTLYMLLLSPIRAIRPVSLIVMDFIARTMSGETAQIIEHCKLCNVPHYLRHHGVFSYKLRT